MHVVLTGATGFIGRQICGHLLSAGHQVTAVVRDQDAIHRRFPAARTHGVDLNDMVSAEPWGWILDRIAPVDAVVNCAGILQSGIGQSARAIHTDAAIGLFDACLARSIRRVVQISAVSAEPAAGTDYARTKAAADAHLATLDLDWIVLRPSLVYGQGSYGGTSFLRGLAGLPGVIPLIGDGAQRFQPIHVDDIAATVARCLDPSFPARRVLDPVGPETMTLRQMIEATRAWLDLPPARFVAVPKLLIRAVARVGDVLGAGPVTTTALTQMEYGNTSDPARFARDSAIAPRSMAQAFTASPSHVQDRWHARLYFLFPLLTLVLGLMWVGSGVAGLIDPPTDALVIAQAIGAGPDAVPALVFAFCFIDILIGLRLLSGRAGRRCGWVMLAMTSGYTIGLTVFVPVLWMDPYGALLKNLPVMGAILTWLALSNPR